jgi:hypothetical protein
VNPLEVNRTAGPTASANDDDRRANELRKALRRQRGLAMLEADRSTNGHGRNDSMAPSAPVRLDGK